MNAPALDEASAPDASIPERDRSPDPPPFVGFDVRPCAAQARGRRLVPQARPRQMARNPVMFVVEVGSVITTLLFIPRRAPQHRGRQRVRRPRRGVAVVHRALRELRGGRRRGTRQGPGRHAAQDPVGDGRPRAAGRRAARARWPSSELTVGDRCEVVAGEIIPGDGDVVEGIASVDESAITGESAPVIRESGGDRSSVTGGTCCPTGSSSRSRRSRARASSTA